MCTDGGADAVRQDPIGFARIQWETWSPAGWLNDGEFAQTAETFSGPDWAAITLNAYRSRWRQNEAWDSRYNDLQRRIGQIEKLSTPTLMIQGLSDNCDPPSESEDQEKYFTGDYQRLTLENVGHFPTAKHPHSSPQPCLIIFAGARKRALKKSSKRRMHYRDARFRGN